MRKIDIYTKLILFCGEMDKIEDYDLYDRCYECLMDICNEIKNDMDNGEDD